MFELYDEEYKATIIKCFKKQSHTQLKLIEEGKISAQWNMWKDSNVNVRTKQWKNNNNVKPHRLSQLLKLKSRDDFLMVKKGLWDPWN